MFSANAYESLHGIRVSHAEGIRCEWRGEAEPRHEAREDRNRCTRNAAHRLDCDYAFYDFNLCTQHAKMVVKRRTGGEVMAEDLAEAAERNREITPVALQAFAAGWSAAMESIEELDKAP